MAGGYAMNIAQVFGQSADEEPPTGRRFEQRGRAGTAVCLSGGGYRAMLFHLGAFRRLNEIGALPHVAMFSGVSGGSIAAGVLGYHWRDLDFGADGVARSFDLVENALLNLAGRFIDLPAALGGVLLPNPVSARVAARYRRFLFGDATLQDLPKRPAFVFNAMSMQTGEGWQLSRARIGDYVAGFLDYPVLSLAEAVAASSAFPPFLSPAVLRFEPGQLVEPERPSPEYDPAFGEKAYLTDGGVYDNLGLEAAHPYRTLLVSNAVAKVRPKPGIRFNWAWQTARSWARTTDLLTRRSVRALINEFKRGERAGTVWSIGSHLDWFPAVPDVLECSPHRTEELARIKTALRPIPAPVRYSLVNWGYAVADVALRSHVLSDLPAPSGFPYPEHALG